MPELPEVETSRRGIEPHILKQTIKQIVVRESRLRWPVPNTLPELLKGIKILAVERRAKYILLRFSNGTVILHLGMSGSLRICQPETEVRKHDHIDFVLRNGHCLRLHDPRRFGCVLWTDQPIDQHKLISKLGPEPLHDDFDTAYLYQHSRNRNCSIKSFIMNSHVVVGVGNIYASESLFLAGIHPGRKAGAISRPRYQKLVNAIKQVLSESIKQGGTTLRDFLNEDGKPGYFAQKLFVYGKNGTPCQTCGNTIKQITQQKRASYYCSTCQR